MKLERDSRKNQLLKETRGVSFEDVEIAVEDNRVLFLGKHPNQKEYKDQMILVVELYEYAYAIPMRKNDDVYLLITIFPSRKLTKLYLSG